MLTEVLAARPSMGLGQPVSLRIPYAGPVMLGKVWGEQSDSFYSATWSSSHPPRCIPLITLLGYAAYWIPPLFTSWYSCLSIIFPLFNGLPFYSCQDCSFSSPLLSTTSDLITPHHHHHLSSFSQRSLRLLCGDISVSKHLEKLNKLGNSYWCQLLIYIIIKGAIVCRNGLLGLLLPFSWL